MSFLPYFFVTSKIAIGTVVVAVGELRGFRRIYRGTVEKTEWYTVQSKYPRPHAVHYDEDFAYFQHLFLTKLGREVCT